MLFYPGTDFGTVMCSRGEFYFYLHFYLFCFKSGYSSFLGFCVLFLEITLNQVPSRSSQRARCTVVSSVCWAERMGALSIVLANSGDGGIRRLLKKPREYDSPWTWLCYFLLQQRVISQKGWVPLCQLLSESLSPVKPAWKKTVRSQPSVLPQGFMNTSQDLEMRSHCRQGLRVFSERAPWGSSANTHHRGSPSHNKTKQKRRRWCSPHLLSVTSEVVGTSDVFIT